MARRTVPRRAVRRRLRCAIAAATPAVNRSRHRRRKARGSLGQRRRRTGSERFRLAGHDPPRRFRPGGRHRRRRPIWPSASANNSNWPSTKRSAIGSICSANFGRTCATISPDPARRAAVYQALCDWAWLEQIRESGIDAVRLEMYASIDRWAAIDRIVADSSPITVR